nr:CP100k-like protein 1 isoform 1 [Parasacculina yatsui]
MTWSLSIATVVVTLLAANSADAGFARSGCGCLRNRLAGKLSNDELSSIRQLLIGRGFHALQGSQVGLLSDRVLQLIFRFMLLNDFPGGVARSRSEILHIFHGALGKLSPSQFPDQSSFKKVVLALGQVTLGSGAEVSLRVDLPSAVPAAAFVLLRRGLQLNAQQLQRVIISTLPALQLPAILGEDHFLSGLQFLDQFDAMLPKVLQSADLAGIRRLLDARFEIKSGNLLAERLALSVNQFNQDSERIRQIFASANRLNFGPNMQPVLRRVIKLFPGISRNDLEAIFNSLVFAK